MKVSRRSIYTRCFATLSHAGGYTHGVMMRCLVVHLLLGRRHLRERDFYAHDANAWACSRSPVCPR